MVVGKAAYFLLQQDVFNNDFNIQPLTHFAGADVTHASPGVRRPSVASLVASYDRSAAQYSPAYSVQEPRTEIISQLEDMLYVSFFVLHPRSRVVNS